MHLEAVVHGHPDQRAATQPQRHARLLDRAVRLGRGVDAEAAIQVRATGEPAGSHVGAARLAGGGQGDQRRGRSGVGQQAIEPVGQPERLAEPVDDDLLELGADRRRPPQHRVLAERRGQHLAEDPRRPTPSSRSRPGSPGAAIGSRSARRAGGSRPGSRRATRAPRAAPPGTAAAASRARSTGKTARVSIVSR